MTKKELIKRLRKLQRGAGDVMYAKIGLLIDDVNDDSENVKVGDVCQPLTDHLNKSFGR